MKRPKPIKSIQSEAKKVSSSTGAQKKKAPQAGAQAQGDPSSSKADTHHSAHGQNNKGIFRKSGRALKKIVGRRRPSISEVVKEPTAGGVVWRRSDKGAIEILLIQDAKDRWTIPKGHIEEGETAKDTAKREIGEETGLQSMDMQSWLGKINFRYRRQQSLVLMTTEIYLVEAKGDTDNIRPEEWMKGIKWMSANDALDKIEYDDIGKLILLGLKKIRQGKP